MQIQRADEHELSPLLVYSLGIFIRLCETVAHNPCAILRHPIPTDLSKTFVFFLIAMYLTYTDHQQIVYLTTLTSEADCTQQIVGITLTRKVAENTMRPAGLTAVKCSADNDNHEGATNRKQDKLVGFDQVPVDPLSQSLVETIR